MTSKNSFLARLIENAKRRIWLLVVSLLVFVIGIPTFTAMNISVISQREILIEEMRVHEALYEFARGLYAGTNGVIFTWVGLFAIFSGIQGFSYLYDRNKIDFYHSKPVKASTRFFSIWANGILVWLIPYIVGMLINLVLFAANGILDVKVFGSAWLYLVLALGLYLCIYHLAVLALMMTGKVSVTCLGIGVFLFYEACIRLLAAGYFGQFYRFFYAGDDTRWFTPVFSPVTYMNYYAQEDWSAPVTMFFLLLFAAVILAAAYWCYKKRPSELAGSAMTFSAVKPVIKIGIAVPVGLCAGLFTCDIVSYDPLSQKGSAGFPIFIGIMGLVITCCLIQVIYEADIKGILHKKAHIVISFVLAMCIALIFRFDLTGFATRLPEEEDMEYVTMITDTGDRWGEAFLDENLTWVNKEEYVNKYMRLTGETAKAARNLAAHSIELYMEQSRDEFNEKYEYSYVVFHFHQKNGSVLSREIPVAMREETNASYIEQIETSEEFILTNESAMSEELMEVLNGNDYKIRASWGNNLSNVELTRKQVRELLELYRADLLNDSYYVKTKELPIGEFTIFIDAQVSYGRQFDFLVYPSFVNSVKYLENNGFETKKHVTAEDIERIIVTRYPETEEQSDVYYEEYTYSYSGYKATEVVEEVNSVTETYSDPAQIQEITDYMYPNCLGYEWWYMDEALEDRYELEVFFKEDTPGYAGYGYVTYFNFLKGQVPAFVEANLAEETE